MAGSGGAHKAVKFVTLLSSVRQGRMSDRVLALTNKHIASLGHSNSVIACHRRNLNIYSASLKDQHQRDSNQFNFNSIAVKSLQKSITKQPINKNFHFLTHRPFLSTQSRSTAMSQCRQNFHEECEAGINKQINMELTASYIYLSLAYYCDRDDVAHKNLHKFFKKSSDEEKDHAEKLMEYQNKRGGRIVFQDIAKPETSEYGSIVDMLTLTLKLERDVNQALIDLHKVADKHSDFQFADFLEGEFLKEQVDAIKEISDLLTKAKKCGPGLGEFHFDEEAL